MWKEEFGADFEVPPAVSIRMVDQSWHNDVCPRFTSPLSDHIVLWADHPDPDQREMGGSRFTVLVEKEYGEVDNKVVCLTEDFKQALDKVAELEQLGEAGVLAILEVDGKPQ